MLDVASGSGLVAIAALMAGAKEVEVGEIDAIACTSISANAAANALALSPVPADPIGSDRGWHVVLVGDAFYEKPLADRLLLWLEKLAGGGAEILLGDPGRSYFPKNRFELLASYQVPVTRAGRFGDQGDERLAVQLVCAIIPGVAFVFRGRHLSRRTSDARH